jgi:hypothetical protein
LLSFEHCEAVGLFQQTALMFAVNNKPMVHLPAATGASFVIAGTQGRRQDLKTPV